jgi:hypothetical protein
MTKQRERLHCLSGGKRNQRKEERRCRASENISQIINRKWYDGWGVRCEL